MPVDSHLRTHRYIERNTHWTGAPLLSAMFHYRKLITTRVIIVRASVLSVHTGITVVPHPTADASHTVANVAITMR